MKILYLILRILGILFFSYRAYTDYGKIDFESEDTPFYTYIFILWLIIILIFITSGWNFSKTDNNKKTQPIDAEKEYLKKIQEEYEKKFVSKT
jgi:hypothetical protein